MAGKTRRLEDNLKGSEAIIAKRTREAVLGVAPEATIVLYGSRARGEASAESDYDLLVLVDFPVTLEFEKKLRHAVMTIELEFDAVISFLLYERSEWEAPRLQATSLYEAINEEGLLL